MNQYFKIIDPRLPAWQHDKIFIMHKWSGLDTMYSCKIKNKEYYFHINQLKKYIPSNLIEVYNHLMNNVIGYFDDDTETFFPSSNDVYQNLNIYYHDNEKYLFEIQIRKEKMDNIYYTYQRIGDEINKRTIQRIKL